MNLPRWPYYGHFQKPKTFLYRSISLTSRRVLGRTNGSFLLLTYLRPLRTFFPRLVVETFNYKVVREQNLIYAIVTFSISHPKLNWVPSWLTPQLVGSNLFQRKTKQNHQRLLLLGRTPSTGTLVLGRDVLKVILNLYGKRRSSRRTMVQFNVCPVRLVQTGSCPTGRCVLPWVRNGKTIEGLEFYVTYQDKKERNVSFEISLSFSLGQLLV